MSTSDPGRRTVPVDDYTPHGYLDLPGHTRRLTPKGVLRTHGVGFRWHFPALATSYGGRRETYRAGFRLVLDDAAVVPDFDDLRAPYHSKNVVRFVATSGNARMEAEFFALGDDVLCAQVRAAPRRQLSVQVGYTRLIAADHGWGESGLVARRVGDRLVLQGFEDGEAFVLEVVGAAGEFAVTTGDVATGAVQGDVDGASADRVTAVGAAGEQVSVSGVVTIRSATPVACTVLLARGRTEGEAVARLSRARRTQGSCLAALLADDEEFWSHAPTLDGDWPDHWRRGLVYDLETLRMMVKQPAGIYRHSWDAMQLQAPRVVLAEAAIDALLLGYADPELAQELLFGTFADAPLPNVPCSREDGTYNMVSADGSVCGTGPQWGYPWLVVRQLAALRPDRDWLARLYPYLVRYLDWWLAHRRDADGWLVHACSWESGQDLSPRFGEQPLGGGHPTWSTRPVDLQAAFADAARAMAEFAVELGYGQDVARWSALAEDYGQRTEQLWNGGRYADWRTDTGADQPGFTGVDDVMLLAPVALGLAAAERREALRPAIRACDADSVVWPMFAWTTVDAALAAGEDDTAARIAGAVVDRAYGFWDARDHHEGVGGKPGRTLPGIACEYWPLSGRCGGEGYGWGAFTTHLLLGVLVGMRPTSEGLYVRPNLPIGMRTPGRRYAVNLTLCGVRLVLTLRPDEDGGGVTVDVADRSATVRWGEEAFWRWEELGCARPS
ncbi:hypothetical protein ABN034_16265 [Actinopolymorpha sp. B11F2]|uniref:MGH1-like glycoside hydrolase domain-containing protein n=1 Tax=Actinopolymorpha sp. B11F2 TaxID=3160862 RepID=UPI0032E4E26A